MERLAKMVTLQRATMFLLFKTVCYYLLLYGKFNIPYNGPTLWNETDERFKILTPHLFKKELTMHFIKFY